MATYPPTGLPTGLNAARLPSRIESGTSHPVVNGLGGWATTVHYSHASTNTEVKLSATGGFFGLLYQLITVPSAANRILASNWDATSEGFAVFGSRASGATPRFITRGAGSTNVDWPTTYSVHDVGKVFFDSGSIDGDADLLAYRQGRLIAGPAAGSGAVASGASSRFRLGDNAEPPNHIVLLGAVFGSTTPLTEAQHAQWFASIRAAGRIVAAPTGTTDLFDPAAAGATWVSSGSSATELTRTGTFTVVPVPMIFAPA